MDILIEKLNGETKKFSELGWIVKDILVSSTGIRAYKDEVEGRPGNIDKGADHGSKTVTVPFAWESYDLLDYPFKRDEIYKWLGGTESFYIYEGRSFGKGYKFVDPGFKGQPWSEENDFIYGKRYLVRRTGGFVPEQSNTWGETQVEFELVGLPFGESAATTLTPFVIGTTGNALLDNIWTTDAEIFRDDLQYEFSLTAGTNTIRVFNGGHETVEPEYMDLYIEYRGRSDRLTMVNQTNGSRWERTSGTSPADTTTIRIDGIESTQSNVDIVHLTTGELLSFAPGWNTLRITGVTGPATLKIDMRWYFR